MSKEKSIPRRGGRPAARHDDNPRQRHVPNAGSRARAKSDTGAKGARMGGDDSARSKRPKR